MLEKGGSGVEIDGRWKSGRRQQPVRVVRPRRFRPRPGTILFLRKPAIAILRTNNGPQDKILYLCRVLKFLFGPASRADAFDFVRCGCCHRSSTVRDSQVAANDDSDSDPCLHPGGSRYDVLPSFLVSVPLREFCREHRCDSEWMLRSTGCDGQ